MISKINNVTSIATKTSLQTKNILKKASLPIAGLTGLSLLKGASGGPAWQFNEVPPIGVDIVEAKDSIDNGIIESLAYKIQHSAEIMELPEKFAELKVSIGEHLEQANEHLENWGDSVIETLSEIL